MLKGCSSGLQQLTFKHNIYTYKKNSSFKNYTSSMWALKAENFVKNRVNDAKFVNFNTAHHFSFKSFLANLLGIKITNFYQKHWLLIFKMVAQRCEG